MMSKRLTSASNTRPSAIMASTIEKPRCKTERPVFDMRSPVICGAARADLRRSEAASAPQGRPGAGANRGLMAMTQGDLDHLRHTAAHLLAHAVVDLFGPEVKLAIGPSIEDGFYYDFLKEPGFTPEDLPRIEARMRELIAQGLHMEGKHVSRDEAADYYRGRNQPFKLELLDAIPAGEPVTMFTIGSFTDLCRGGHVDSSKAIGGLKLLSLAGAYWRGD